MNRHSASTVSGKAAIHLLFTAQMLCSFEDDQLPHVSQAVIQY
jgi:hypothetical protein